MKAMKKMLGVWVAVMGLAACGREPAGDELPPVTPETRAPDTGAEPAPAGATWMELRLLGENGGAYDAALMTVSEVEVTGPDGLELPVSLQAGTIDLAQAGEPWKVARFAVPAGTEQVVVRLRFDDFGGFEAKAGTGVIETAGVPIQFEMPVSDLRGHDGAVIFLDLERALRPSEEGNLLLVPQYRVRF
jgi:hypothetical protein